MQYLITQNISDHDVMTLSSYDVTISQVKYMKGDL